MTDDQQLRILFVGATGSIGRHAIQVALERGDTAIALTRAGSTGRIPDGAQVLEGDLADQTTLQLPDVDAVVFTHGAHGDEQAIRRVDYGGVENVLAALGDQPTRVALMTAIGVTGDGYPTHRWKRQSERLVRASGRPYTIVRPGWFDYNDADQQQLHFLQGDRRHAGSPADGVIARRQIAEVLIGALHSPAADRLTFELVAERGPAQPDLEPLFAALDPDPDGAVDGVHDQPAS